MAAPDATRPHDALAARVAGAAAALPEAERTALRRRELDGRGYAEIGAELGIEPAQVAPLLVRARLKVREAVRHAPAPPEPTEHCADARAVLCLRQDGGPVSRGELERLREHVDGCDPCRLTRRALREASLACRSWQQGQAAPAVGGGATLVAP